MSSQPIASDVNAQSIVSQNNAKEDDHSDLQDIRKRKFKRLSQDLGNHKYLDVLKKIKTEEKNDSFSINDSRISTSVDPHDENGNVDTSKDIDDGASTFILTEDEKVSLGIYFQLIYIFFYLTFT